MVVLRAFLNLEWETNGRNALSLSLRILLIIVQQTWVFIDLKSLSLCFCVSFISDSNIERVKKYSPENLLPAQFSVKLLKIEEGKIWKYLF